MTAPVLFKTLECRQGRNIGVITLNAEKTLNSLTLEMIDLIYQQLISWRIDDSIGVVLINASGEKAFCAGGDVQALHASALSKPGGPCEYAESFFTREYRLNYLLHSYAKPIICWGHGIVMGGGLGILAACSHRIVTEKTRIAMPEVSIALFPDVGGSWFLNRMPGKSGVFLALTGASINATDSLFTGIADDFICQQYYLKFIDALTELTLTDDDKENHHRLSNTITPFSVASKDSIPAGNVELNIDEINRLCGTANAFETIGNISSLQTDNSWLSKAKNGLANGSPLGALIIFRQLQMSQDFSLAEVFQSEIQLATHIIRYPEFSEGVRALLIDKDKKPQWQFNSTREVSGETVDQFFSTPNTGSTWPINPLADL
ncbi:MAG: enoyl-CoA hydratase/carnithine racemase [Oceanicoccus sp.]|jgi:enoyl-CoA hydratase/carnithine racemase